MENHLEADSLGRQQTAATRADLDGTLGSGRVRSGTPARPTSENSRPPPANTSTISKPAKRARKDRGANWNTEEVIALIQAKRQMFIEEIDADDARDLMNPDTTKWERISNVVMLANCSPCPRDGASCKTKWNQLIIDYKKIADFFSRTGNSDRVYWKLTATNRKSEGLPRSFTEEIFYSIHEWFGSRPQMNPPHIRDLMSSEDGNFQVQKNQSGLPDDDCNSDPGTEDPMDLANAATQNQTDGSSRSVCPDFPDHLREVTSAGIGTRNTSPTCSPMPQRRKNLTAGVSRILISSSGTSGFQNNRHVGNTGVRRKSVSGHGLIAEATRASGAVMASQMKEMADASRSLEESKMEVQRTLFSEQMQYQREKDERLHDNARFANETARLAIERQVEMVKCLSSLSHVLSGGMHHAKQKQDATKTPVNSPTADIEETMADANLDFLHAATSEQPSAIPEI